MSFSPCGCQCTMYLTKSILNLFCNFNDEVYWGDSIAVIKVAIYMFTQIALFVNFAFCIFLNFQLLYSSVIKVLIERIRLVTLVSAWLPVTWYISRFSWEAYQFQNRKKIFWALVYMSIQFAIILTKNTKISQSFWRDRII